MKKIYESRLFEPEKWRKILIVMKIKAILLLCCVGQAYAADSFSQQTKFDVDYRNVSITTVLEDLEARTGYTFVYQENILPTDAKVSAILNEATIEAVLDEIFVKNGYSYSIGGKVVVIEPKVIKATQQRQSYTLQGTVQDQKGNPLIGVSVVLKDRSYAGTATDANGHFSMTIWERSGVLSFSCIGFKPQDRPFNGSNANIVIVLEDAVSEIEEVVVTG